MLPVSDRITWKFDRSRTLSNAKCKNLAGFSWSPFGSEKMLLFFSGVFFGTHCKYYRTLISTPSIPNHQTAPNTESPNCGWSMFKGTQWWWHCFELDPWRINCCNFLREIKFWTRPGIWDVVSPRSRPRPRPRPPGCLYNSNSPFWWMVKCLIPQKNLKNNNLSRFTFKSFPMYITHPWNFMALQ